MSYKLDYKANKWLTKTVGCGIFVSKGDKDMRVTSNDVILAIIEDETLKERFERFFDKHAPDECWNWKGAKTVEAYGLIFTKRMDNCERKMIKANRLALFFKTYLWPQGMVACHTCDNPSCVNPNHLYWGTDADNSRDMVERGRHWQQILTSQGRVPKHDHSKYNHPDWVKKPNRRLYKTEEQRASIKRDIIGASQAQMKLIAERERMSFGMCAAIKYGHAWKTVQVPN